MEQTPWSGRRLHFVGVGGAGMSGLALVARALGADVTGSDRAESPYMAPLRALGVEPAIGHDAANVPAGAELVVSTAIPPENPERAAGREQGLRELHRADLLGELTRAKRTIAVTGTHGKTTTAAMAAHALRGAGLDPSYLLGGELRSTGANAGWGKGEWLVVEADESDRSLLSLDAEIAVLTNCELDHHSTYASLDDLRATFADFLARARAAVVWDRPDLLALAPGAVAYDVADADADLEGGGARFTWRGQRVTLRVPGIHNARNAAGALEACRLAGAEPGAVADALGDFPGTGRRFEHVGTSPGGAEVYDDYAHHPTEVAATLAAARTMAPRRLVAAFQPHLFSRTAALHREFGAALAEADVCAVLDIYPAREHREDFPGVSGLLVARAAADAGAGRTVMWLPERPAAERALAAELRAGDLFLTLGAGDIDSLARSLAAGDRAAAAKAPGG